MTLSVIIPTKNRQKELLDTLESVMIQTHLPDEIIIIDQNTSLDVKNAVLYLFNSLEEGKRNTITLKYVHDPMIIGLTQARNRGIERNESDIVIFLDDDVILEEDFIFNILEIYRKYPEIHGVSGTIKNTQLGFIGTVLIKFFMIGDFTDKKLLIFTDPKYKSTEYVAVSILPGGLTSYRREILREFSFDENFINYSLSEDFDFSFRVSRKYKIVITPRAKLTHVCTDSGKPLGKKLFESLMLSYYYFFKKNLEKNICNYLCYIWLIIGYLLYGMTLAVFRQNTDVIAGCFSGIKKLIRGQGSDYIQRTM